jgi:hypothetical protein
MSDAPDPIKDALDAARRAAEEIVDHGSGLVDLADSRAAFQRLRTVMEGEAQDRALLRIAVCGATRYLSIGRRIGDIRAIREAHFFLSELTSRFHDDPLPHRALAEASVDLMLAEARFAGFTGALHTYRSVLAISEAHAGDPHIASAQAKGAANLVALALEADAPREAERALDDLARLEAAQPNILPVRQQRGRGLFNRVAHAAQHTEFADTGSTSPGLTDLAALIEVARRAPIDPELIDLAAEGLFAVVTGLGTRGELGRARRHYDDLTSLARLPEASDTVHRRVADAAFNLITDLCEADQVDVATLLYDDLSALSVARETDRSIRLAQAKAAANLVLTRWTRGDLDAAWVVLEDLRILTHAYPDDMEMMEILSYLDLPTG